MKKYFSKVLADKDFFELFHQGKISLFIRIGGQIMGFLMSLIIAHYFGAKSLGSYVLVIVVLQIFSLISKLGLDTLSVRFIAAFAKKNQWRSIRLFRRKVLSIISTTSIFSSILMFFLADNISDFIDVEKIYVELSSFFILPMVFFMLHYQSLRGLKKIAEYSFFYRMSQATFTIIVIFIFSNLKFDNSNSIPIFSYLLSLMIVSVLSVINFYYWFNKKSTFNSKEIVENLSIISILKVSIPLMLAQSVQFIMAWTDKLMIGSMLSAEDVAIYGVAFRFSMGASITLMAINSISSPKFSEKFSTNDITGMGKIAFQSAKMIFWSTLPIAFILLLFPDFFMGLYGAEFLFGSEVLKWLIIGRIVNALSGSVGNLMQMSGEQKNYMKILILGAFVNVTLNYLLIPLYGIKGAAIASVASLSLWNLLMVFMIKRRFGFLTIYLPFIKR